MAPSETLHANFFLYFDVTRSSVCRMSSKEKLNLQDQSKERGVSAGLELSEDKESSPGKTAVMTGL